MTEYVEPDDGCYWKLIPLDDWGEAMTELDRCNEAGINIQLTRNRDEDGQEYLTIAESTNWRIRYDLKIHT
jgi:hypothetical protein